MSCYEKKETWRNFERRKYEVRIWEAIKERKF